MRRADWPERLYAAVQAAADRPFAWGSHDCVLWPCDIIREMTGFDPAQSLRGAYTDVKGAMRIVRDIAVSHGTFWEAIDTVARDCGYVAIPPSTAHRGDLVLCPSGVPTWPHSLGICLGTFAAITGERGLVRIPMTQALAAWAVD